MEIARAIVMAIPDAHELPWLSLGSRPKSLAPVATKPVLFHTLEALRSAGVLEAALVTEPELAPAFRAAVDDGKRWGMSVSYVECERATAIRDVLELASGFVEDEPVLIQRADVILRSRLQEHIASFAREHIDALALMLTRGTTPEPSHRAVGGYLLNARAVSVVLAGPAARDPLQRLRRQGSQVRVLDVEGCLACQGDETALLEANRHVLWSIEPSIGPAVLEGCEIQGPAVIHPTATLRNTLVRGPVIIGPRSQIVDSYVGPYSSIGDDVRIEGTEIEHSIVMDGAQLLFVGSRLETSIIGRGASIVRRFDLPSAVRMSIGDGAHVALS